MSAYDKFAIGEYVNISPELAKSFRHHTLLRGAFPAGRVLGYCRSPYQIRVQLNGTIETREFDMDDWERP